MFIMQEDVIRPPVINILKNKHMSIIYKVFSIICLISVKKMLN